MTKHLPRRDEQRLWSKVHKTDGCWLWTGAKTSTGYGLLLFDGRPWLAHRLMYTLTYGPIGDLFVCHHCDNPLCVRPDHLFTGTTQDNTRDMKLKGRASHGNRHHHAKLTDETVREMRRLRKTGLAYHRLGKLFGVTEATAHKAATGRTWTHVQEETA